MTPEERLLNAIFGEEPVRFKGVQGGTAPSGTNLCLSCKFAQIVQGPTQKIVYCRELAYGESFLTFPVVSCSLYVNKNHPSLQAMEDVAWIIRTKKVGKDVGFAQGREVDVEKVEVVVDEPKPKRREGGDYPEIVPDFDQ